MFKHANEYVPGSKVRISPLEGAKVASTGEVGTIEDVDPDHATATIKTAGGDSVTVDLVRIEHCEG